MFNYKGKVVVVTGASSGLGAQMSQGFAEQGASLALLARRVERLESLAKELNEKYGVEVLPVKCDVTDDGSIAEAVKAIKEKFGHVEVLVNCAGGERGTGTPALDYKPEDWEFTLKLDLTSIFKLSKAFGNVMKDAINAGAQKFGRIINIASIYGLVGNTAIPTIAYHTSKGAVVNFTRGLAAELAHSGLPITVNAICPGYFYTELTQETLDSEFFQAFAHNSVPMQRYGNPGELNSAAVFLGAEESSYVTGQILAVDGGYTCI
jgi:gluconate 5-dehydrogenase